MAGNMADNNVSSKPATMSRWVKLLLGVSLAFNLAIMGLFAGVVLRGAPKSGPPSAGSYATAYVRALPREDRRDLFKDMRKSQAGKGMSRAARSALYQDMLAALRAEDLDIQAVRSVLDRQRDVSRTLQDGVQDRWLALVSEMSFEERLVYADALEEASLRKRRDKKKRDSN